LTANGAPLISKNDGAHQADAHGIVIWDDMSRFVRSENADRRVPAGLLY